MSIFQELKRIPKGKKDLRKFGMLVGMILMLLGAWFFYRGKPASPFVFCPGVLLFFLGLLFPGTLLCVYLPWMGIGLALGFVVSQVLLTLLFFLLVTPLGLFGRIIGKDFLRKKLDRDAASYWIARTPRAEPAPETYLRQF